MNIRLPFTVFLLLGSALPAFAQSSVHDGPDPKIKVAELWENAKRESHEKLPSEKLSELARMLNALNADEKLGLGVGWYGPSERLRDWAWLVKRMDANGDARIRSDEWRGPPRFFQVLDRDRDGVLTRDDLDWSVNSLGGRQDSAALKLLRAMDLDGNGQVNEKEWLAFFKRSSGENSYLTANDFRQMIAGDLLEKATGKVPGQKAKGKKVSREVWLRCLFEGDLGSAQPGPSINDFAPDFTLPKHEGKETVTLSSFRDKKPVVLIFGSFT